MGKPAHDDAVFSDHLLAIDAEVLPLLVRAARDGEAPGDERAGVLEYLVVALDPDEIHTPDSSRYWFLESYARRFEAGEPPETYPSGV